MRKAAAECTAAEEKKEATITNPDLVTKSNGLNFKEVLLETSWKNRSLLAVNQAGLFGLLYRSLI